jgi:hypothetical protein
MTHRTPFQFCAAIAAAIAILAITRGQNACAAEKLVVHEWGTFTSLQDENGKALGGINVDDEPVPDFVYGNKGDWISNLRPQYSIPPRVISKGAPQRNPYVTMRLETPVMYFYLPKSLPRPTLLNVNVEFRGGWLTQFYPFADANAPGHSNHSVDDKLERDTVTRLTWDGLRVGLAGKVPATTEAVWLTPRNVKADNVSTANGEGEKYLFYRGVGNVDAPLSVSTDLSTGNLSIRSAIDKPLAENQPQNILSLWLVHIRPDGTVAYRTLKPVTATADHSAFAASTTSKFGEADYSRDNLLRLQRSMHAALMSEGLFDEEATAMLQTWQKSYFAAGGLRLFYIVPRPWVDDRLPLTISQPAEITRVMMARTELVSPEQRDLLKRLATAPRSNPKWVQDLDRDRPAVQTFLSGHSGFGDLGVTIPQDYQLYMDLGRFRNALVLHEAQRNSNPSLTAFINNYALRTFYGADERKTP